MQTVRATLKKSDYIFEMVNRWVQWHHGNYKDKITYIIVVKIAVDVQLVEADGALEGVDEGALRDLGISPYSDRHLGATLGEVRVRGGEHKGELLGDQNTRFHRTAHLEHVLSQELAGSPTADGRRYKTVASKVDLHVAPPRRLETRLLPRPITGLFASLSNRLHQSQPLFRQNWLPTCQ